MVSPFPFDALPRISRGDLAFDNALARWLAIAPRGRRVEALVTSPVAIRGVAPGPLGDAYPGTCALRIGGALVEIRGGNALVRTIAQRVLGGPAELAAPRPLGLVEQSLWALVVAAAVEDLGIAGEVVACESAPVIAGARELVIAIELAGAPASVGVRAPRELALRVPPPRIPGWAATAIVDVPVVIGRCAIETAALERLAVRTVVTLEPALGHAELVLFGGAIGLAIPDGELVAAVTTGYVPRSMALPDDARVELTVGLGTTQLSLRQVFELAVGAVVPLGRPLAGPFEIRAAGKLVGQGELVSVDGELGVRIVSLEE